MATLERKNYPALGNVSAPYVHAVKHGDTLYVSGLTAFGSAAQGAGMAAQAEEIFRQMTIVAQAEGTDVASLIKVTIFITTFAALREVLFRHYGDHLPASSLVEVSRLFSPDLQVEIEGIFAL